MTLFTMSNVNNDLTPYILRMKLLSIIDIAQEIGRLELKLEIFNAQYNKTTKQLPMDKIRKLPIQIKNAHKKLELRMKYLEYEFMDREETQ